LTDFPIGGILSLGGTTESRHVKDDIMHHLELPRMWYQPDPAQWRNWFRTRVLTPKVRAALQSLELPERPLWRRVVQWWVATPSGLFANFFGWFAGLYYFGPVFFMPWMIFALGLPASIIYFVSKQDPPQH